MLSTFPPMISSDGLFGSPFPAFETGFTPWDYPDPPFEPETIHFPLLEQQQEPVNSNSGSDNSNSNANPIPVDSNSGSDEPNVKNNKNSSSGSPGDSSSLIDERKRRRMISNRESARRSRMRKQKHLENLRNQVNRLRVGNRELMNRLRFVTHHCHLIRNDNDRLRSESVVLRQRLWDIRQVLLVRELHQQQLASSSSVWPCNNFNFNDQETIPQSLIT